MRLLEVVVALWMGVTGEKRKRKRGWVIMDLCDDSNVKISW
jgi:hypothetical protein